MVNAMNHGLNRTTWGQKKHLHKSPGKVPPLPPAVCNPAQSRGLLKWNKLTDVAFNQS